MLQAWLPKVTFKWLKSDHTVRNPKSKWGDFGRPCLQPRMHMTRCMHFKIHFKTVWQTRASRTASRTLKQGMLDSQGGPVDTTRKNQANLLEPSCLILEPELEPKNNQFGAELLYFGASWRPICRKWQRFIRIWRPNRPFWSSPNFVRIPTTFGDPIWSPFGSQKIPDLDASGLILEPVGAQFVQNGSDLFEFGGQIVPLETSELC